MNGRREDVSSKQRFERRDQLKEVEILATGLHLPGDPVPFEKIEEVIGHLDDVHPRIKKMIEKLRPKVKELIGIKQCHFAVDPRTGTIIENNTTMATKAIRSALKKANLEAADLDCILLANPFADTQTPPTTTYIQEELGLERCAEMEIHSNCTGISKVMQIAYDALRIGRYRHVAVCYAQLSSAYLLAANYNQAAIKTENLLLRWFLSDSASAAILSNENPKPKYKLVEVYNESVGGKLPPAMWSQLGVRSPNLPQTYASGAHHLGQDYSAVNELAPAILTDGCRQMLALCGLKADDIALVLSTIPSIMIFDRIREMVEKELGIPKEKWFSNAFRRGYSGGSSVIMGLDEVLTENMLKPGEHLATVTIESSKWMVGGFVLKHEVK